MTGRLRELLQRASAFLRWRSYERDLDDELVSHQEAATADYIRRGLPLEEAHRRARIDFGSVTAAREQHRAARGFPLLATLAHDVRYAVRTLRRASGFSAAAVLILALGIGANTAVFSIVNPLLLKPLPFRNADQLVWIADAGEGLSTQTYSVDVFEAFRTRSQSFSDLSAFFAFFDYESFRLNDAGGAEALAGVRVAPRFFEVLGVAPTLGRLFTEVESAPGGPQGAIISHGLWQRRFGADPAVIGHTLRIATAEGATPPTILGVMPADFDFGAVFAAGMQPDLFLAANLNEMRNWGNVFSVVGRLKPGSTLESARAEFATLVPTLLRERPEIGQRDVVMTDLKTRVTGAMARPLSVLWAAVVLVLLIACANLSNLLLARASGRQKELAIRIALGASRGRVLRQVLAEGVALASAGAMLGLPIAYALAWYVRTRTSLNLPLLSRIEVDASALAFTAIVALFAGLLAGLLPALRMIRQDPQRILRDQSRGSSEGPRQARVRSILVVAEVAIACVLLVGAGLLMRSFVRLISVDVGFQPSNVLTARVDTGTEGTPAQRTARLLQARDIVSALPAVEKVGLADALPFARSRIWGVTAPGRVYGPGEAPSAFVYIVSDGYMDAMRIPVMSGRDFSFADDADHPRVMVVNETLAASLFPDQDPIGRDVRAGQTDYRIVGVVADVRQQAFDEQPVGQMYLPIMQVRPAGVPNLVVRSAPPLTMPVAVVRAALRESDPALITSAFMPLTDVVDHVLSPRRFLLMLIGAFALLALVLASLGIYAVIAYGVSQQTREIGIRMALGATDRGVRGRVMVATARLASIGIGMGLIGAFGAARLIATLLYGTSPFDPLTFGAVAMGLIVVALVAGYIPAWRASRIDPVEALRGD